MSDPNMREATERLSADVRASGVPGPFVAVAVAQHRQIIVLDKLFRQMAHFDAPGYLRILDFDETTVLGTYRIEPLGYVEPEPEIRTAEAVITFEDADERA